MVLEFVDSYCVAPFYFSVCCVMPMSYSVEHFPGARCHAARNDSGGFAGVCPHPRDVEGKSGQQTAALEEATLT